MRSTCARSLRSDSVVPKPVATAIRANVRKPDARWPDSGGRLAVAELLERDDEVHRLTADERRKLLAMVEAFPIDALPLPGWGGPHVTALTEFWLSLKPPHHGNYAYLRVRGMEYIALAGMRKVILTTPWGTPRD